MAYIISNSGASPDTYCAAEKLHNLKVDQRGVSDCAHKRPAAAPSSETGGEDPHTEDADDEAQGQKLKRRTRRTQRMRPRKRPAANVCDHDEAQGQKRRPFSWFDKAGVVFDLPKDESDFFS